MLRVLSVRSPLLLRVFLTAMSALAAVFFASAFSFSTGSLAAQEIRSPAAVTANPAPPKSVPLPPPYNPAAAWSLAHQWHLQHEAHVAKEQAAAAPPPPPAPAPATTTESAPAPVQAQAAASYSGTLTAAQVGQLWLGAGGPEWAESQAVQIADCESSFNVNAYNASGASGIWQILGAPQGWTGSTDWFNPAVNAAAAVAKFRAAGDTFAAWVCQ